MMDRSVFSTRVAAGGGAALETIAVTMGALAVFPAPSRATAVNVWDPSATVVVFQVTPYGTVVSSAASGDPSRKNRTPTTSMLSEASALTVTVPLTDVPLVGDVMVTVGAVVSGGAPLTSKASTTTRKSFDAGFFVRVTS